MAATVEFIDRDRHVDPANMEGDLANFPLSTEGEKALIRCRPRPDKSWGRVCEFHVSRLDRISQLGVLHRHFGAISRNRHAFETVIRGTALTRLYTGWREKNFDGTADEEVRCPDTRNPNYNDGKPAPMFTCAAFRRADAGGEKLREMMRLYFEDRVVSVRDELSREFCSSRRGMWAPDCACINRSKDPEYVRLVESQKELVGQDNCWYLPCKSGAAMRDPDLPKAPCHVSVCQVVTNIEAGGGVQVDRTNIDMTGCGQIAKPPAAPAKPAAQGTVPTKPGAAPTKPGAPVRYVRRARMPPRHPQQQQHPAEKSKPPLKPLVIPPPPPPPTKPASADQKKPGAAPLPTVFKSIVVNGQQQQPPPAPPPPPNTPDDEVQQRPTWVSTAAKSAMLAALVVGLSSLLGLATGTALDRARFRRARRRRRSAAAGQVNMAAVRRLADKICRLPLEDER